MPSVFVFAVDIVAGMARTPPIVADWHCFDRRCLSQCGGMSSKCSLCGVRVTDAVHSRIIGFVSSLLYYTCTTINISRVSFRDRQKKTAERHTKTQRHVSTCSASRDVRRKKQWESCSPVTAQEWSQWAMKRQHQQCWTSQRIEKVATFAKHNAACRSFEPFNWSSCLCSLLRQMLPTRTGLLTTH